MSLISNRELPNYLKTDFDEFGKDKDALYDALANILKNVDFLSNKKREKKENGESPRTILGTTDSQDKFINEYGSEGLIELAQQIYKDADAYEQAIKAGHGLTFYTIENGIPVFRVMSGKDAKAVWKATIGLTSRRSGQELLEEGVLARPAMVQENLNKTFGETHVSAPYTPEGIEMHIERKMVQMDALKELTPRYSETLVDQLSDQLKDYQEGDAFPVKEVFTNANGAASADLLFGDSKLAKELKVAIPYFMTRANKVAHEDVIVKGVSTEETKKNNKEPDEGQQAFELLKSLIVKHKAGERLSPDCLLGKFMMLEEAGEIQWSDDAKVSETLIDQVAVGDTAQKTQGNVLIYLLQNPEMQERLVNNYMNKPKDQSFIEFMHKDEDGRKLLGKGARLSSSWRQLPVTRISPDKKFSFPGCNVEIPQNAMIVIYPPAIAQMQELLGVSDAEVSALVEGYTMCSGADLAREVGMFQAAIETLTQFRQRNLGLELESLSAKQYAATQWYKEEPKIRVVKKEQTAA